MHFLTRVGAPLLALLLVPAFSARAASDPAVLKEARAALTALADKQRAANAVSLSYESRALGAAGTPMPPVSGFLIADGLGRFRLEHAQGVVVSDGETLWQYSPANRQVVIRDAARAGSAGSVLLRFLDAHAVGATRLAGGDMRVVLDPASVGESLDSLVLTLSRDGATVRRVETEDPAGNRVEYEVKSLRQDARPGADTFTFKAPAGVETVDMR